MSTEWLKTKQDKTSSQAADWPFPVKPVCPRNGLNSSTRKGTRNNLHDFNRQNISKQEASHGLAKEIQMREQILQEKLRRLGEKIKQKISIETDDLTEEDEKMQQREKQSGDGADGRETMLQGQ